jgi:murein DD-endopeptidase MepM/ murein hydrolase activator NlpD
MKMRSPKPIVSLIFFLIFTFVLAACLPEEDFDHDVPVVGEVEPENLEPSSPISEASQRETEITTFPSRPRYSPGELVEYIAQSGDTLPNLASRFNTSVDEILEANSFIPKSATTMPPGMPMEIPIYYLPLWGSPFQIIPDSHFVNGPAQVDFNTQEFVEGTTGWLKDYEGYVGDTNRNGAEIIDYAARNYSISPRLFLALLEYHSGALSQKQVPPEVLEYPLGIKEWRAKDLYPQLIWAANLFNNAYYEYRTSQLLSIEYRDGRLERIDPWQNAATVSLRNYFNTLYEYEDFVRATSPEGFADTYQTLFGDPWQNNVPHIPGTLLQPEFILPFEPGDVWAYTGGPHTAYGRGEPFAALDFAPPSKTPGCVRSGIWATAVASGVVVRSEIGQVMIDLDGDGDERTGWNIYYLHVATNGRIPLGSIVEQGDPIGHPSCEGGTSTGTHIHIARKYNGEWITAEGMTGVLPFTMEGWTAHYGSEPYLGTLTRSSQTVTACTCSNAASFIKSDRQEIEKEVSAQQ